MPGGQPCSLGPTGVAVAALSIAPAFTSGPGGGRPTAVEYAAAAQRARLITPVPGGVGPITTAVLLAQTAAVAVAEMN